MHSMSIAIRIRIQVDEYFTIKIGNKKNRLNITANE